MGVPSLTQIVADREKAKQTGEPIIRLVDVYKSFGSLRVLAGVNLELRRGQTTVIMGPSGTGKSVLIKHIVGLIKPDKGEVWFHDKRMDKLNEHDLVEQPHAHGVPLPDVGPVRFDDRVRERDRSR